MSLVDLMNFEIFRIQSINKLDRVLILFLEAVLFTFLAVALYTGACFNQSIIYTVHGPGLGLSSNEYLSGSGPSVYRGLFSINQSIN